MVASLSTFLFVSLLFTPTPGGWHLIICLLTCLWIPTALLSVCLSVCLHIPLFSISNPIHPDQWQKQILALKSQYSPCRETNPQRCYFDVWFYISYCNFQQIKWQNPVLNLNRFQCLIWVINWSLILGNFQLMSIELIILAPLNTGFSVSKSKNIS